jgi:hypothetical protein
MAVVDRVRPSGTRRAVRHRSLRLPEVTLRLPKTGAPSPAPENRTTSTLPWFAPDSDPGTVASGRLSAPHEDSPTTPTKENT